MADGGESRLRIVVDAGIWIDLHFGGVLAGAFRLSDEFVSPDVILAELVTVDPQVIIRHGCRVEHLTPDDYGTLQRLVTEHSGPSVSDLTALLISMREGLMLLAGDSKLRKAAETEGVEVHGILWLLDRMIAETVLSERKAAAALRSMLDCDARLPRDECERRLLKWG